MPGEVYNVYKTNVRLEGDTMHQESLFAANNRQEPLASRV